MIKVLGLALYGPLAASTRYRLGQYVSGLASMGIDLQIRHLLGDDYLRARFRNGPLPLSGIARSGVNRLAELWHADEYDLAIVYGELFPLMPGWMERALIRKPYIYDFDDAFYLKYRSGRLGITGPLLAHKFDSVIAGAAAVTAGNQVLNEYGRRHNSCTHYLPTVVDTERYIPQPNSRGGQIFTVGWIGSPSTTRHLSELVAPLSILGQDGPVRLIIIGGKAPVIPNVDVIQIAWDERTEVELINSFDIGVMPLIDDSFTRGKCAFKLIQYMACAIPVIASPVGANNDVVNNETGFLASTIGEWVDALALLRDQPGKRREMGEAGRERVWKHYSLQHNLPRLAGVIRETARKV